MKISIVNKSRNLLPSYATEFAAGMDLYASIQALDNNFKGDGFDTHIDSSGTTIILRPGGRVLVPTDLFVAIPEGFEIQIRPRSGLAIKNGITCLNTPGTIDSDYRGNIGVILINHGFDYLEIKNGDRIAQAVLNKVEKIEWDVTTELPETKRAEGGFGHTGV